MTKGKKRNLFIFAILLIILAALLYSYQYSVKRLEFLGYYNKVYAHRVNSIEKLNQALKHFKGVELDLVYNVNTDKFDVNHPPAESINLSFESYLSAIKTDTLPFLWLDIKNLESKNSYKILSKLEFLVNKFNYPKDKLLVESLVPVALRPFNGSGFKTSYYLKPKLYLHDSLNLKTEIKNIRTVLKNQPYLAISASYENYDLMHKYFPKETKYMWAITSAYHFKQLKIREVLKDSTVAILLSSFKAKKGNR